MSASWITKLNLSNSRLHKEDVVLQALEASVLGSSNAQNFLKFAKACYNPYVLNRFPILRALLTQKIPGMILINY